MRWAILNSTNQVIEIKNNLNGSEENYAKLPNGLSCQLGWIYVGHEYKPPTWTAYQFLLRLTQQERADIRERAKTDPNVADFLMLCQSAQEVISNDPVTVMGMDYMVSIGVFTEQRKKEILQILE
jgi:hypothetical protein